MKFLKQLKKINIVRVAYYSWLIFLAIFFFNLFYPYEVVTFSKFETTKKVYAQGEPVCVDMAFVKHRDFKGNIRWLLIDGIAYELPVGQINRGVGPNEYKRCFDLKVPSGDYHIRVEAEYNLLVGLRRILREKETKQFTIE